PCAASIGLSTLDGFSTTAMMLAPLHGTIDATTVTPGTVLLYEFNGTTLTRIPELKEQLAAPPGTVKAGFVAEPPQLTQSVGSATVSTVIGLQPAVAVDLPPPFAPARIPLPPLKDSTEYAVIVTDGVKDFPTGQPLQTSTLQKILLFSNPLVDASGKSLVGGV